MSRSLWQEVAAVVVFLIVATIIIASTNADIIISARFFIEGHWPIGEQFPWKALYRIDRFPAIALAVAGLSVLAVSLWQPEKYRWARQGAFLVLLLILGPGLLVNATFKDHWGRPRPRDIVQFEGKQEFLQPWQRGIDGKGRSFPSGHGSAAFYMTAPYFIYRRSRKRLAYAWLAGGLSFGILMSIARITQGGHFLSDNIWAWGMVHLCALFLAALLKIDRVPPARSNPAA